MPKYLSLKRRARGLRELDATCPPPSRHTPRPTAAATNVAGRDDLVRRAARARAGRAV
jgi:hypothetical protein